MSSGVFRINATNIFRRDKNKNTRSEPQRSTLTIRLRVTYVAKARPQFDPDDDDVRHPDAWLFQHPLSLAKRFSSASNLSVYIFPVPVALKIFITYWGIYRMQRDIIKFYTLHHTGSRNDHALTRHPGSLTSYWTTETPLRETESLWKV